MIHLGHIHFSNCFPVHALLLDRGAPVDVRVLTGMPSDLNAWLAQRRLDVAPASSIEFARHADRYRILPDVVIGSHGAVQSILLESLVPLPELDGREIAVPTASATSVVLLRILLELRLGIRPRYRWFRQEVEHAPLGTGAAAALWIGDAALLRAGRSGHRHLLDLGAAWTEWSGLPFGYALWLVSAGPELDGELTQLHGRLLESRAYFEAHAEALATRHASRFGLSPERLLAYWRSLHFQLDEPMRQGLARFYELAVELGETPAAPPLRFL